MVCDMQPGKSRLLVEEGLAYINAAGLQIGGSGGSLTYVTDESNFPYRIPLSCINAPLKYLADAENKKDSVAEKNLKNIKI